MFQVPRIAVVNHSPMGKQQPMQNGAQPTQAGPMPSATDAVLVSVGKASVSAPDAVAAGGKLVCEWFGIHSDPAWPPAVAAMFSNGPGNAVYETDSSGSKHAIFAYAPALDQKRPSVLGLVPPSMLMQVLQQADVEIQVSGAGGKGSGANGVYRQTDTHQGKPKYAQVGGQGIIFFSGHWKINDDSDTRGWYYGAPPETDSESQPPTGKWTTRGYSPKDADPPPLVTVVYGPPPVPQMPPLLQAPQASPPSNLGPPSIADAVKVLMSAYKNVFNAFLTSGCQSLRLVPMSGNMAGDYKASISEITARAAYGALTSFASNPAQLQKLTNVQMCVYLEKEFQSYKAAFSQHEGLVLQLGPVIQAPNLPPLIHVVPVPVAAIPVCPPECMRPGCDKPTWNGNPNEYCSNQCRLGSICAAPPVASGRLPVCRVGCGNLAAPGLPTCGSCPSDFCVQRCGRPAWPGYPCQQCHGNQNQAAAAADALRRQFEQDQEQQVAEERWRRAQQEQAEQHKLQQQREAQWRAHQQAQAVHEQAMREQWQRQQIVEQERIAAQLRLSQQHPCWRPNCGKASWNGAAKEYCCMACRDWGVRCKNEQCRRSGCTDDVPYCSLECRDLVRETQAQVEQPLGQQPTCPTCVNFMEWSCAGDGPWQCAHFALCQNCKTPEVDPPRGKYGCFRWRCQRCNANVCGTCGKALCKMVNCTKPTHDGQEGYCSQDCLQKHLPIKRQEDRKGGRALCNRPGCGKPTWDRTVSGEWCSTACKNTARPRALEATNYQRRYDSGKAFDSTDQVWAAISTVLRCLYLKDKRDEGEVQEFVQKLMSAVREAEVKAEMAHKKDSPMLVVVFCWTCSETDRESREWCSYLQEAVRLDLDDCMQAVADIWRTMNQHVVVDRLRQASGLSRVAWPASNMLHRGGRLPEKHAQWFRDAARDRTIFRNKMATSTTKIRNKASNFMENWGYPKGEAACYQVHWKFKLDPEERCVHVNCLEDVTLVAEEQEFLFPPFSAFRVTKVEWFSDHYVIEVDVMPDNKSETFDGPVPVNAPLGPWS